MTAGFPTTRPVGIRPLLRAAHIGPSLAVTCVVALLALGQDLPAGKGVVVTAAVFTGQLTIGWGNDLIDATRDRRVGRPDKPLASGELTSSFVLRCLLASAAACVVLSLLAGWRSALVHLCVGVACGHLYNLVLKGSLLSWLPYALAFGTLPAVVTLADVPPHWPPAWMLFTAGALGVAAHFLNTLPDIDDDVATGVRGLPHRLGPARSRVIATLLLVVASATAALGPTGAPVGWSWAGLAMVAALTVLALVGRGKAPFYAAIAIALIDVMLLTVVVA
ncbi:UbiA family prenyltransferase [Lapillicoccus sp.]|uniref:UbiA family prenyltransferase n=1 Tax=Lapillicoccus sp. TaxID=1909287 RepID=UPI003266EE6E